jgi:acyl-coenzyme A synthetase/AMP-(fatty) acid ligase
MSAVVETGAPAGALPLVARAQAGRPFAWANGRAIAVGEFLADVAAAAATLPPAAAAVNLCEDRYAFLVAFCALLCRGQANLLPPSRAPHAVDEALATSAGSQVVGDTALQPAPARYHRLPLPGGNGVRASVPAIPGSQLAVVGFTSGSTGQPRANRKTWQSLHASSACNIAALEAVLALAPDEVAHVVATVPPQHMYGIELTILLPLLGPFAVHGGRPLFPADVADALASVPAPRVLVTTPVHLRALLRDGVRLPPLAAITSATAPLPPELAAAAEQHCGAPLLELFGSTETCVIAQRRSARGEDWQAYPGIGVRPQPDGTLVEAAWFDGPVSLPDVIEPLPGNRFRLRGRQSDLVEIAGKRASLADLTRRVLALGGVEDAVVVQLDEADSFGVRRIAALVVAPSRGEADLLAELRGAVDAAFLPRPLRRVAALPRNETGKLPRGALLAARAPGMNGR